MPAGTVVQPEPEPTELPSAAIKEQLHRLLSSSLFNHSRRYPSFLSYVVGQTLTGNEDQLKERTIGINVFGRAHDYDLNADPVVRVTAGKVRKRLAQYYYAAEHHTELRIELHPGSYVPGFRWATERSHGRDTASSGGTPQAVPERPDSRLSSVAAPTREEEPLSPSPGAGAMGAVLPVRTALPASEPVALPAPLRKPTAMPRWWALAFGLAVLAFAVLYRATTRTSALDTFWTPVMNSSSPVLISVGSWGTTSPVPGDISIGTHAASASPVALADTITIAGLQQFLSQRSKPVLIQTSTQTSFSDLQRGTTILVSAFDNPWTMRLVDPLRFHFVTHEQGVLAIEDREDSSRRDWRIDTSRPYANLTRDFGIIARFYDPTTEETIIVAAGIGENGTIAAGQALTNPQFLQAQPDLMAKGKYRNMEAVVETTVIGGKSGPPRLAALTTW